MATTKTRLVQLQHIPWHIIQLFKKLVSINWQGDIFGYIVKWETKSNVYGMQSSMPERQRIKTYILYLLGLM